MTRTEANHTMKLEHNTNTDQEKNVMRPGRRSLTTIGLAGVLAVLAQETLIARATNADVNYKAELSPLNVKSAISPTPSKKP